MSDKTAPASHFDQKAKDWDNHAPRVQMARAIFEGMNRAVPFHPDWHLLDFGCGTGLLGLQFSGRISGLVGLDTSSGMVDQFNAKAPKGFSAEVRDLGTNPWDRNPFDSVVSAMALHHCEHPLSIMKALADCLKPGGWLALADLDEEDGSFHTDNTSVFHHGFAQSQLLDWGRELGLLPISSDLVHHFDKNDRLYGIRLWVFRKAGKPS